MNLWTDCNLVKGVVGAQRLRIGVPETVRMTARVSTLGSQWGCHGHPAWRATPPLGCFSLHFLDALGFLGECLPSLAPGQPLFLGTTAQRVLYTGW